MAKKKNLQKKHKFRHDSGTPSAVPVNETVREERPAAAPRAAQTGSGTIAAGRDFGYVTRDLRRIVLIVAALVAVEVILYILFQHTPVGPAIDNLVKV